MVVRVCYCIVHNHAYNTVTPEIKNSEQTNKTIKQNHLQVIMLRITVVAGGFFVCFVVVVVVVVVVVLFLLFVQIKWSVVMCKIITCVWKLPFYFQF